MSDEPPPSTVISTLFRFGSASRRLLGGRALAAQTAALADGELRAELRFHQPGERQIEIVAAEQQVLADGGAREIDAVAFAGDADQAEIAGAAADVADQHHLAVEEQLAGAREIVGDPGIERRRGLFEQRELRDAGFGGGGDGQLARFFIERRGHGEDDIVIGERGSIWRLSQDSRILASKRAETSTGDSTRAPSGESQGRILAVRSTPGFESQLLAECTSWVGTSAP